MGRNKVDEPGELIDVFIHLEQERSINPEAIIKRIEEGQGRILHVLLPYLIIAQIPDSIISTLKTDPAVHSIDTEAISEERLDAASENNKYAYATWNDYLERKTSETSLKKDAYLSWDAPGRLPPDPPPHMREILRKKEEEQKKSNKE
jgi:hypothetical protein